MLRTRTNTDERGFFLFYPRSSAKSACKASAFYFYLSSSIPFISSTLKEVNGELKLLLEFPKDTQVLTLTVGMSNVDEAGAKSNLQAEIPHFSIQQVYNQNVQKWNQELGKIQIQSIRVSSVHGNCMTRT